MKTRKKATGAVKLRPSILARLAEMAPVNDANSPASRWLARPLVSMALGVQTVSLTNLAGHTHNYSLAKVVKRQREASYFAVLQRRDDFEGLALPLTFVLVRVAPRSLDDGNLGGAFKAVQDGLTDGLSLVMPKGERPASDRDGLRWVYGQRAPREHEQEHTEVRVYRSGDAVRALLRLSPTEPSALEEVLLAFADELDALLVREVA